MHSNRRIDRSRAVSRDGAWLVAYFLATFALWHPAALGGSEYERDVLPILRSRCHGCHGAEAQEGELRLDSLTALRQGGLHGPVVSDAAPDQSLLLLRLRGERGPRMPLDEPPLSAREFSVISDWIAANASQLGAIDATVDGSVGVDRHWAFQTPRRPTPPTPPSQEEPYRAWLQPIDRFLADVMTRNGLTPSPRADRATLLRRVTLDLTGMPPSLAELTAFESDRRPNAYERVVERLLASPRYGERWAVPWLDLARYADTNGYQADQFRSVWPFRDWVVAAINRDLPFDRFTIEQIAGDLCDNASLDQRVASGFHRLTTCNVEAGVDPEENRVQQIVDRVNTTGAVWLGLTIGCAQCHDHKYEPFTQHDYYRLFACFNNTPLEVKLNQGVQYNFYGPSIEIPHPPWLAKQQEQLEADRHTAKRALEECRAALLPGQQAWEEGVEGRELDDLDNSVRDALAVALAQRTDKQRQQVETAFLRSEPRYRKLEKAFEACRGACEAASPPTALVMVEMPEQRATHVLQRGDFQSRGDMVNGGIPALFASHDTTAAEPMTRRELANWLVDRNNPLTARVTVNRWWAQFFGRGIVTTLNDFGHRGERPTHPQLLDWLAVEFMEHGWSRKHVHRTIVLSEAYRQSSSATEEAWAADPHNAFYARGPRQRLSAEMIRDHALAVSGLLSERVGGPPVFPPQPPGIWRHIGRNEPRYATSNGGDRFRRGMYTFWRRSAPYPAYVNFDAPDRASCVMQRAETNTPLQALTLMNDRAYLELAAAFALDCWQKDRKSQEDSATAERVTPLSQQISLAFRRAVSRAPEQSELQYLVAMYRGAEATYRKSPEEASFCRDLLPPKFASFVAPEECVGLAAWFRITHVLLNLDETITKS